MYSPQRQGAAWLRTLREWLLQTRATLPGGLDPDAESGDWPTPLDGWSGQGSGLDENPEAPPVVTAWRNRLVYCREVLQPVWERWTNGHPAMRRALACDPADGARCEELCNTLHHAQKQIDHRSRAPAHRAASLAAQACQYALLGYPELLVVQVAEEAWRAHDAACASLVVVSRLRLLAD